eukprot:1158887-Pelagomonas_calceolata.AAC.2
MDIHSGHGFTQQLTNTQQFCRLVATKMLLPVLVLSMPGNVQRATDTEIRKSKEIKTAQTKNQPNTTFLNKPVRVIN